MARIFLSYRVIERDVARDFQEEFKRRGHEVAWDVDALVVGTPIRKIFRCRELNPGLLGESQIS